jgi:hypothetical protein
LRGLEPFKDLDERLIRAVRPDLLEASAALTSLGLDYFRILRNEEPILDRHTRKRVGVELRHMFRKRGDALSEADFPRGHSVPLLAYIYWGGVRAWVDSAPQRAQKGKGFWKDETNQIEALRKFAEQNADASITTATLHAAGLHTLALGLNATTLSELVIKAGLGRNLKHRPDGYWTMETTIAAYVAECERAGLPLSNYMLAQQGGIGLTIRSQAQKLFKTFRAFRSQVGELHAWLKPGAPCQASNGQVLDSWQEVAFYEVLLRKLPAGVSIKPHVRLEGLQNRRSVDFLVGGVIYVEVLMISLARLTQPERTTEQDYARKWGLKKEWYTSTGKALVVVEPDDICSPSRMVEKAGEVLRLLGLAENDGCAERAHVSEDHTTIRAKGYWTFEKLCEVVKEVAQKAGGFPTHVQLAKAGYESAPTMLTQFGRAHVAQAIGIPLRNQKGTWTHQLVVDGIVAWVREHDTYPTLNELKAAGQGALANAWQRYTKGATSRMRPEVEQLCGKAVPPRKAAAGSYETQAQLAALLRPLCDKLGRFPTRAEVRKAGLSSTIWGTVSVRYGVKNMASYMGVHYQVSRRQRSKMPPEAPLPLFSKGWFRDGVE